MQRINTEETMEELAGTEKLIKIKRAKKIVGFEHEILDRLALIKKDYATTLKDLNPPTDSQEFIDWLWDQNKGCQRCLLSANRNGVVKPDGNALADIMVVLEGPGPLEDAARIPLVGPLELRGSHCGHCTRIKTCFNQRLKKKSDQRTNYGERKEIVCRPNYVDYKTTEEYFWLHSTGAILDGMLVRRFKYAYPRLNWIKQYNGNNPDQPWTHHSPWFFTNVVMCRSYDKLSERDVPPPNMAISKCKEWLAGYWAAVQPKVIIALGKPALITMMGSEPASYKVQINEPAESKYGTVLYNVHPAHIMREKNKDIKAHHLARLLQTFELALEIAGYPV